MGLLKKRLATGAAVLALGGFLAACDNGGDTTDNGADTTEENGDAVTAASITSDPSEVAASLSADGNWITALTADVTVEEDITVAGTFHDGGDEANDEYRKLALYEQDDDRNVTGEFTLTVPTLTVESPNFRIQNGTVDGDVYVDAEGFELEEAVITGNLTFASEDIESSASINGDVQGETTTEE